MAEQVRTARNGAALTISIEREANRNALNETVAAGIAAGLDEAEADRSIRAVILTGAGDKAFAPAAICSLARTEPRS